MAAMQSSESLLEFPCDFAVKIVGLAAHDFDALVVSIVRRHVGDINEGAVASKASREGKYIALTVTVRAESRPQLDALYTELSKHDRILMVL